MINARHLFYGISMLEKYFAARAQDGVSALRAHRTSRSRFRQPLEVPRGPTGPSTYTWITGLNLLYWGGCAAVGVVRGGRAACGP